jgi:hypothetical protein
MISWVGMSEEALVDPLQHKQILEIKFCSYSDRFMLDDHNYPWAF